LTEAFWALLVGGDVASEDFVDDCCLFLGSFRCAFVLDVFGYLGHIFDDVLV